MDADSGVVAIRRHPDGIRPVVAAGRGAVLEEYLHPVLVLQLGPLAVEGHRVLAPEVAVVADLVLGAVELLAHLGEPQGHGVAVLADALGFGRGVACAGEVEVSLQPVAVVLVLVDGAVDVPAAALAEQTSE